MSVSAMRQVLGDTLRGLGVAEESVYDILLAVTEACTNVLGHGRPNQHWTVTPWRVAVCTSLSGAHCQVEVTGPGHRPRSLSVARACVDHVTLRYYPGRGTVVTLRKDIAWTWDAPLHRLAATGLPRSACPAPQPFRPYGLHPLS
jgi:serine/threonine-protein kinase RsbW